MKNKFIFFVLTVVVLTLNFSAHILSTLPLSEYYDEEFPSEQFVISRSIYNLENDIEDYGGVLFFYDHMDEIYMSLDKEDFYRLKQKISDPDVKKNMYLSHSGLQDNIVYPIWLGLNKVKSLITEKGRKGSRWVKRLEKYDIYYFKLISQTVISFFNALVFAVLLLWVTKAYSLKHGYITLALMIILLPILGFYGRSMWWMMWSWFLPFTISALGLAFASSKNKVPGYGVTIMIGAFISFAIGLKTAMGYEFLPTILVSALIPFSYYAVYHGWGIKKWFSRSFIVSILCLAGVGLAFVYHMNTLANYGSSDPLSVIMDRFEKRAYGGEGFESRKDIVAKSTREPLLGVIGNYLVDSKGYGFPQILLMIPLFVWLLKKRGEMRVLPAQDRALLISIALGFVGALSMLVILKGHAHIHGYDIVIWSIPMNILLCVFYAQLILKRFSYKNI